jgi:phage terminase large subunit-like protein
MLEKARHDGSIPNLVRVVIGVDPSGSNGDDNGDAIGIVVCGVDREGTGYVLADRTCKLSPDGWGRAAVAAYHEFRADCILAEVNFGGSLVRHVIRTVDPNVPFREIHASVARS